MRVAVIDIGTNSTRLLVAEVDEGRVQELERTTHVTRLGEGVDASGALAETAMERVFATVAGYRREIQRLGAERTIALATSAVRDAANGEVFRSQLTERFGIEARTISGDQEARLTFDGATSAREPGAGPLLVLDIGGGSTEFVVGRSGAEPEFHVSTQAGSVRHTERCLHSDPPTAAELEAAHGEIRATIEQSVSAEIRASVASAIAVAGTATNLAAIDQALDPYDPKRVHGYVLSHERCEQMLDQLASLPVAERRALTGMHPDRAPTIVAGAVILVETLRAFGLDAIEASEADILHGAALALACGRLAD